MTLLLGFAAVNTGNNLLYLLVSALLGFMAISGILGRGNITGLEVAVETPDEIYDGVPTLLRVRLANRRRFLPAFLVRISVREGTVLFPFVDRGASASAVVSAVFRSRGRFSVGPARICSNFPINFFVRCCPAAGESPVTVFPAPVGSRALGAGERGDLRGESPAPPKGLEGEMHGIADYRGEPLKLIHWKLSARHDELKVRELSAVAREPVVVEPARLPGRDLEERLRRASFLLNRYQRENRPVGLKLGERLIAPAAGRAHKLRLLTELATYGSH